MSNKRRTKEPARPIALCERDGNHAVRVWGDAVWRAVLDAPTANAGPLTGRRIKTKIRDCDTGENGKERAIPIGTFGNVGEFNGESYEIQWDNGGMTFWLPDEIARDADEIERAARAHP